MSPTKLETICEGHCGPMLTRYSVPGGWVYTYFTWRPRKRPRVGEPTHVVAAQSSVFVPDLP